MTPVRLRLVALLAVVAIAIAVTLSTGGSDTRTYKAQLANAAGLRVNDDVRIDGVNVGRVSKLSVTPQTSVVATVELREDAGRLGHDARAEIRSANLFGGKFLALVPGDTTRALPAEATIPLARTSAPVEIDEVLDTLDAPTRTRLATLINQAGLGVAGRGDDLASTLAQLPPTLDTTAELLRTIRGDNRSLGQLVERSDRVVGSFAAQRRELARLVSVADTALSAPSARPDKVAATLREAAPTLRQLQTSLGELRAVAEPLGPAADELARSAKPLAATLREVPGLQRAAAPTLATAKRATPALRRLGARSTPALRRAAPTLARLADLSVALDPVTKIVQDDIRPTIGVLQGWARATQVNDSLGHMFRGEFVLSPAALTSIFAAPKKNLAKRNPARPSTPSRPATDPGPTIGRLPIPKLPSLPSVVNTTTNAVTSLLDFLLTP